MEIRGPLSLLGVVLSMGAATAVVLNLAPEDRISIKIGAIFTTLGFVFFISLSEFLVHVVLSTPTGKFFRQKYGLSLSDALDIINKLVSAVQAALSCLTGVIVCLWSCTRSLLHASHFMSEAYAWFGAAYFFYDIWSMYEVHACETVEKQTHNKYMSKHNNNTSKIQENAASNKTDDGDLDVKKINKYTAAVHAGGDTDLNDRAKTIGQYCKPAEVINEALNRATAVRKSSLRSYIFDSPIIIMHHLFIGSFGFLVIVYLRGGLGDCVFGFVYLMELSTPFVSLRGILSKMGLKTSRLYVVNGLVMLATFFFCRVAMFPYVCYMYSQVVGLPYWQAIWSLPTGCKISITILMLPQLYWFYLMLRGAFKVFFIRPPAKTTAKTPEHCKIMAGTTKNQFGDSNTKHRKND